MNEMLSSGVGHFFDPLINTFLASWSASWQPNRRENNTGDPPPQQQRAPVGDGCHIAMLPSVAIVN